MNETDQDVQQQPPKRTQFPLWFLLFVIPTVAGLGFAIYTNWHQQSQMRADLIAHQEVLRERIATMESEIALVEQMAKQIQWRADRWKSADSVVDYLKAYHENERAPGHGSFEVPLGHDLNTFFLRADEGDMHRLLKLLRETYPACDNSNKYSLLDFAINIPTHAPHYVHALTEDARRLAEVVPDDANPLVRKQAQKLRQVFHLDETSGDEEATQ